MVPVGLPHLSSDCLHRRPALDPRGRCPGLSCLKNSESFITYSVWHCRDLVAGKVPVRDRVKEFPSVPHRW